MIPDGCEASWLALWGYRGGRRAAKSPRRNRPGAGARRQAPTVFPRTPGDSLLFSAADAAQEHQSATQHRPSHGFGNLALRVGDAQQLKGLRPGAGAVAWTAGGKGPKIVDVARRGAVALIPVDRKAVVRLRHRQAGASRWFRRPMRAPGVATGATVSVARIVPESGSAPVLSPMYQVIEEGVGDACPDRELHQVDGITPLRSKRASRHRTSIHLGEAVNCGHAAVSCLQR